MSTREDNIRKTIFEIFNQRSYSSINTEEENKITAKKPDGKKICAFTNIIGKLKIAEIHSKIAVMENMQIKHCIIVFEGSPTPVVKDIISKMQLQKIFIELFEADELQFNITKHQLVPKHRLLSHEESQEFKKKYGINIPKLLSSDPVARFYDFKKGSIIEITRKNDYISYRIVV